MLIHQPPPSIQQIYCNVSSIFILFIFFLHIFKKTQCIYTVPKIIRVSAKKSSLSWLEQMQRYMSGFISNKAYNPNIYVNAVAASAPAVTGTVVLQRFILYLAQCYRH